MTNQKDTEEQEDLIHDGKASTVEIGTGKRVSSLKKTTKLCCCRPGDETLEAYVKIYGYLDWQSSIGTYSSLVSFHRV